MTMIGAAILVALALTAGVRQIALHGPAFFVFRHGGTGATAGDETDQAFLAQQKAAAPATPHRAPGRRAAGK